MSKLYSDLASWWPLLSPPEEYTEEAVFYGGQLSQACAGELATILELGAGGGNNASHLKRRFDMTLVDLSPAMVERVANDPSMLQLGGDKRDMTLLFCDVEITPGQ